MNNQNMDKHLNYLDKISEKVDQEEADILFNEIKLKYQVSSYKELSDKFFEGELDIDPQVFSKISLYNN